MVADQARFCLVGASQVDSDRGADLADLSLDARSDVLGLTELVSSFAAGRPPMAWSAVLGAKMGHG